MNASKLKGLGTLKKEQEKQKFDSIMKKKKNVVPRF
jgi:hypothetical protein